MKIFYLFVIGVTYAQNSRISGGGDVDLTNWEKYKFVVSIEYDRKHICAGSFYANSANTYFIVTAAHCIAGLDKDRLRVRYGSARRSSAKTAYVDEGFVHSNYISSTYQYDIGVLKITTTGVTSIPRVTPTIINADELDGVILGWGSKSSTELIPVNNLQMSSAGYVSFDSCSKNYTLATHMFCVSQAQGGACYGDDGGPFIVPKPGEPNTLLLAGIISWGSKCGPSKNPKVMIRVSEFDSWLATFK